MNDSSGEEVLEGGAGVEDEWEGELVGRRRCCHVEEGRVKVKGEVEVFAVGGGTDEGVPVEATAAVVAMEDAVDSDTGEDFFSVVGG